MEATSELAIAAYIYGSPLVASLNRVRRCLTEGTGEHPRADLNTFSHGLEPAGPATTRAYPDNDTVCSIGNLDLSGGPVLVTVPDTGGDYSVVQFVDAWTNNFAYLGRRATGTDAARFLVCPPDWAGPEESGDLPVVRAPTTLVTALGRFAFDGDLSRVRGLQHGLTLSRTTPAAPVAGLPVPDAAADPGLAFWESLRVGMRAFPPGREDRERQRAFEPLGLLATGSPYRAPDPALRTLLVESRAEARAELAALARQGAAAPVNGWIGDVHEFDHNLDHFAIGALDDPAWITGDRATAHRNRAVRARENLWGSHGYEVATSRVAVDVDGERLDGRHLYRLHFDRLPPVDAFWSLTMYDIPHHHLVDNPLDRHSLGDRTRSLHYNADGSLTLSLGHTRPEDPLARANWLPAPDGPFRPVLRMYQPRAEVLDGRYRLPGLTRVPGPSGR